MICILTNFFKSSKRSLSLFYPWGLSFFLCLGGCFYQLALEKPQGTYSSFFNLKSTPLVIAPALDAPGFPESGKILSQSLHDLLQEKGFSLIWAPDLAIPSPSSRAILEANNLPERLGSNFLLIGSILEYAQEASAIGSAGFPAWQGTHDEYIFLPTYRQGYCDIRIKLTLWNLENKFVVWEREGKISGPSFARQTLLRRLLRHLCTDFPP